MNEFYAVVDASGGIVSVTNKDYDTLKAIFFSKEEAEKAITKAKQKTPQIYLRVERVGILGLG